MLTETDTNGNYTSSLSQTKKTPIMRLQQTKLRAIHTVLLIMSLLLFSTTSATADYRTGNTLELVIFESKPGISTEQMIAASRKMTSALSDLDGYVSRAFWQSSDGLWVDTVYWENLLTAEAAAEAILSIPAAAEFLALIEESTITMRHAQIVIAP